MCHQQLAFAQWLALCGCLLLLSTDAATAAPVSEACAEWPQTVCLASSECSTLKAHLAEGLLTLSTLVTCGFNIHEELICCPTQPPAEQISAIEHSYTHLAALYYYNAHFDDIEPLCTAAILTTKYLLCSAICLREANLRGPIGALLAERDLYGFYEHSETYVEQQFVDLTRKHKLNNDIALLEMKDPIRLSAFPALIRLAQFCDDHETETQLYASGWALAAGMPSASLTITAVPTLNASDKVCPFYELPLQPLSYSNCSLLSNERNVLDLGQAHRCVRPSRPPTVLSESCSQCLISGGSFLHARRSDGHLCVIGMATPLSNDCTADAALLYTKIDATKMLQFIQNIKPDVQ